MSIFEFFKNIKTEDKEIPNFDKSDFIRKHFIFKGRVQGVGFRYTLYDISNKIGLTGKVRNLYDGTVEAEIQGEIDKIEYVVNYMKNRQFIGIDEIEIKEIDLVAGEKEFIIDN